MSWGELIDSDQWKLLFQDSPVVEQLASIDRELVDPRTTWEKTIELRGMRLGIISVQYHAEALAMIERQPKEVDEPADREERDLARIEKILGYRPLWTKTRKPTPPQERKVARFRRGA